MCMADLLFKKNSKAISKIVKVWIRTRARSARGVPMNASCKRRQVRQDGLKAGICLLNLFRGLVSVCFLLLFPGCSIFE